LEEERGGGKSASRIPAEGRGEGGKGGAVGSFGEEKKKK